MNRALKAMIVFRFGTQDDFATAIGENPSIVSKVIRGRVGISSERQLEWAKTLGCEPNQIFEDIDLSAEDGIGNDKMLFF